MQEYNDGTFGEIIENEALKSLFSNPEELMKTKAIHFGTREELEAKKKGRGASIPESYQQSTQLDRVEKMLSAIIAHFKIPYGGILRG